MNLCVRIYVSEFMCQTGLVLLESCFLKVLVPSGSCERIEFFRGWSLCVRKV
jgi:hypothetical protein